MENQSSSHVLDVTIACGTFGTNNLSASTRTSALSLDLANGSKWINLAKCEVLAPETNCSLSFQSCHH